MLSTTRERSVFTEDVAPFSLSRPIKREKKYVYSLAKREKEYVWLGCQGEDVYVETLNLP